jgi:hypothetical protein
LLSSSFNALWSDRMQGVISIFLYLLSLLLCPKIWSILKNVPWNAEKMNIVQKLDEIFCRHQLGLFDLWCHLVLGFLWWCFCLDDLSIGNRGILKSPTTTVLECICASYVNLFSIIWDSQMHTVKKWFKKNEFQWSSYMFNA